MAGGLLLSWFWRFATFSSAAATLPFVSARSALIFCVALAWAASTLSLAALALVCASSAFCFAFCISTLVLFKICFSRSFAPSFASLIAISLFLLAADCASLAAANCLADLLSCTLKLFCLTLSFSNSSSETSASPLNSAILASSFCLLLFEIPPLANWFSSLFIVVFCSLAFLLEVAAAFVNVLIFPLRFCLSSFESPPFANCFSRFCIFNPSACSVIFDFC